MKCYDKSNNNRLPSVVLQLDSNLSASSDYNSDNKSSYETLSIQSSIDDNSSNDGFFSAINYRQWLPQTRNSHWYHNQLWKIQ